MVPAPFIVVVDANVLFPLTLRDTVLRAAAADFYQLRWSKEILDQMERNLVATGTMPAVAKQDSGSMSDWALLAVEEAITRAEARQARAKAKAKAE
jgi:hypothetical protein